MIQMTHAISSLKSLATMHRLQVQKSRHNGDEIICKWVFFSSLQVVKSKNYIPGLELEIWNSGCRLLVNPQISRVKQNITLCNGITKNRGCQAPLTPMLTQALLAHIWDGHEVNSFPWKPLDCYSHPRICWPPYGSEVFFYPSLYSLCLIGANEEEALNIKVN